MGFEPKRPTDMHPKCLCKADLIEAVAQGLANTLIETCDGKKADWVELCQISRVQVAFRAAEILIEYLELRHPELAAETPELPRVAGWLAFMCEPLSPYLGEAFREAVVEARPPGETSAEEEEADKKIQELLAAGSRWGRA